MKTYFKVTIKFKLEDEQGKLKPISEEYLVDAVNFTEAEAIATNFASNDIAGDFTIDKVVKTKIVNIITND